MTGEGVAVIEGRDRRRTASSRGAWALLVALTSLTACGARWTDEQRASVVDRDRTEVGTVGPASATATAGDQVAPTAVGGAAAVASTPQDGATSPAGGAAAAATPGADDVAAAALPCAAPSDAPGVSDTEITLGSLSSLTGPVPGLGASSAAAARAYVAFRNATGGVCGRQLVLLDADDGSDNGRNRSLVGELAPRVLGLAGGLSADGGSADIVAEAGLPFVAGIIGDYSGVASAFDVNPPVADPNARIGKYDFLVEQGVRTAALVYIAHPTTRGEAVREAAQMTASGIEIVNRQELPLSTLSYDAAARAVANSGADYVLFIHEANASAAMARALADAGYTPMFAEYVAAYGSTFPDTAGPAAEGATTWIRSLPTEDGGVNPEQAAYLQWMADTAPDAQIDILAADSWAAMNAFTSAMEAVPGPLTRAAVVEQLAAMTEFDADGFFGPVQLGPKLSNSCYIAVIYQQGAWRRLTPADGFLC